MTKTIPFPITAGLPFTKTFIITLPTGRNWWTSREDFEIRSQIREKPDVSSTLILDFTDYMSITFDGDDEIVAVLQMNGEDTRSFTRSGFYDFILSDVGTVDGRAYKIAQGSVRISQLVTSA